ncbi:transforming growth factor beta regulator 1 [Drosophila nasuta]|uniref:transforming growth factor beta regulator 1 n=1 Tax=Drosophila nasuta TaxID=42062 RepID=UPI00295E8252|nr:transforming growth factor beta regulator 1 [Drosophila nasuta]
MDYKQKYARLKHRVKNYVLENTSIIDEVCILQAELAAARSERLYLIEKLMFYEGLDKSAIGQIPLSNDSRELTHKYTGEKQIIAKKINKHKIKEISKVPPKTSMFPLKLHNILIHTLGEILPANPNFHTSQWIYPVGYVATRIFAHPRDPRKKCVFTCKILNNAGVPQFQLIPDNDLDGVFFGETANICHQELLNSIQGSMKDTSRVSLQAKGESFFGLSNSRVQSLLLSDPRIEQCVKFKGYSNDNINEMYENTDPTLSFAELQIYLT